MSDTDEMKELLDRLRGETRAVPQEFPERTGFPPPERAGQQAHSPRREGPYRSYRPPENRPVRDPASNPAWSENKEAMLFGMLASLIAALGGILAGLDYLVMAGAAVFALFSLVMCLALFRVAAFSARRQPDSSGLEERIDALSKRVEMLSSRAVSGGAVPAQGAAPRDRELEQKVEELRVLVKSLAKAVESGNK